MDAISLLAEARNAGVSVEVVGSSLKVVTPGIVLPHRWQERLEPFKAQIIAYLNGVSDDHDDAPV